LELRFKYGFGRHLGRHGVAVRTVGHRDDILKLKVFHGKIDNRGVFLHEKVVLGEALDVHDQVLGQAREHELALPLLDVVRDLKLQKKFKSHN